MKEKLEKVIAELTERRGKHAANIQLWGNTPEMYGRTKELEHCIKLLKEVLADEIPKGQQIRSEKDDR